MMFASANMHSFCTASGDAGFAARMAAFVLLILDIAVAVSIFVILLADIRLVAVLLLGILALLVWLPHMQNRRKNRLR